MTQKNTSLDEDQGAGPDRFPWSSAVRTYRILIAAASVDLELACVYDAEEQLSYLEREPTELAVLDLELRADTVVPSYTGLGCLNLSGTSCETAFPLPEVTSLDLTGTTVRDGSRWVLPASVRTLRLDTFDQLSNPEALLQLTELYVAKEAFFPEVYYLLIKDRCTLQRVYTLPLRHCEYEHFDGPGQGYLTYDLDEQDVALYLFERVVDLYKQNERIRKKNRTTGSVGPGFSGSPQKV